MIYMNEFFVKNKYITIKAIARLFRIIIYNNLFKWLGR